MKKGAKEIPSYLLDSALYPLHKDGSKHSDFGMDNSSELLEGSFGLYSSANIKSSIGPIKSQYYRIALILSGSATFGIGIERHHPKRHDIVFGFPGQVFSLQDLSEDFFVYYMLFKAEFMEAPLLLTGNRELYPFFTYTGTQVFPLEAKTAQEVEGLILRINSEIKSQKTDAAHVIRLYLQLILAQANRTYNHLQLAKETTATSGNALFRRFIKLVSQHFLKRRKVSDYAELLHVSADHLNRTIKLHSEKTANELIDAMLLTEAKAYLLHTELSNAEIAYRLDFSDPSHFNKFFKKQTMRTPQEYRSRS